MKHQDGGKLLEVAFLMLHVQYCKIPPLFLLVKRNSFLSRNPTVLERISNLSIDLINKLFNKLIEVATDTANNRLIRTLISLCEKTGNALNLTHQEIAQTTWTTLETTTRILSKLRKDNIVGT